MCMCSKAKHDHYEQQLSSWSTSLAILYSAVTKVSTASKPATVYRGVNEQRIQLPKSFIDGIGGVELAAMSTTADRLVVRVEDDSRAAAQPRDAEQCSTVARAIRGCMWDALAQACTPQQQAAALRYCGAVVGAESYSGIGPISIFEINSDTAIPGADLYPLEKEMLYPPGTQLTHLRRLGRRLGR